jgi:hypothetical protein
MTLRGVPRGVVVLGLVSLCMDLSSEMIHSLLPLYLATGLGVSMFAIGMLEGAAEALALVVKVFSGAWVGQRAQAQAARARRLRARGADQADLRARAVVRMGRVRALRRPHRQGRAAGAPRDALIADITPGGVRGAAFGLRQALDTVGAVLGPIAAIAALAAFAGNFQHAFWIAVIPAAICVALILFGVDEPDRVGGGGPRRKLALADAKRPVALVLARHRHRDAHGGRALLEAFLVLRAADVGFAPVQAPWVMVVMSIVYAATAYPAGKALDAGKGGAMLYAGLATLVAAHASLAFARDGTLMFAGAALWGLHMGLDAGHLRGHGRRARARRPARHRVRRVQLRAGSWASWPRALPRVRCGTHSARATRSRSARRSRFCRRSRWSRRRSR